MNSLSHLDSHQGQKQSTTEFLRAPLRASYSDPLTCARVAAIKTRTHFRHRSTNTRQIAAYDATAHGCYHPLEGGLQSLCCEYRGMGPAHVLRHIRRLEGHVQSFVHASKATLAQPPLSLLCHLGITPIVKPAPQGVSPWSSPYEPSYHLALDATSILAYDKTPAVDAFLRSSTFYFQC